MKKRLICMLTLLCVCIASLASFAIVAADESTIISDKYSGGATYEYAAEGGVFYATNFKHADELQFNFKEGMTLNETEHTYVHMKGIVSENVSRIKLNSVYLTYRGSNRATITFDENGVFEYHALVTAIAVDPENQKPFFAYDGETKFKFQMYVDGGGTGTLNMLGVVFNNSETFDDFAEPYTPSAHEHSWAADWSHDVSTHWHACLNGCEEKNDEAAHEYSEGVCVCGQADPSTLTMTIGDLVAPESSDSVTYTASKDATTGYQTITVLGTSSWNYYSLTISNLEAGKDTLYLVFENDADVELFYKINGTENWTIGYVTYKAGLNSQAIPVAANAEGHVVIEFCIEAGKTVDPVKTVVFTSIGFEAPQLPEVEKPAIEDITTSADVAITKDETTGYQTLTYSVSPGWRELKMVINEFDSSKTYAKVTFEHQNSDPINLFYIVNGNENHDIGWKAYGKGESVEYIPLSGLELSTPWTFAFFLDSNETLTGEKVVVFKSLEFVTEDDLPKAPEGLHFTASTEGGITCVTNENGGWDVSWNNDSASWRNVSLVINNYETAYDILKLSISATAGTNVGIRWHYVVVDEDGETPLYARVRTHDGYEGIVGETGTLELVYFAKAYNMQGLMQTKVEIWFDCPTGTSTNVGAQSATINSVELLKSSDISFEALAITAEAMTVDFTGEAVQFVASSNPAVALVAEYEVLDSTGKMVWTKSAPSKAGTYNVRVMFMGSLVHDYTVVTSTLTINKVAAVTAEGDVSIDPETRIVTVAEGVVASLAEDFAEGYEVLSGDEIAYGSVVYYYRAADDNHTQGAVLSLTFNRPVVEDPKTSEPETSAPATSDSEPKHEAPEKGCFGSVAAMGAEATILMMGAIAMFIRRKRK